MNAATLGLYVVAGVSVGLFGIEVAADSMEVTTGALYILVIAGGMAAGGYAMDVTLERGLKVPGAAVPGEYQAQGTSASGAFSGRASPDSTQTRGRPPASGQTSAGTGLS